MRTPEHRSARVGQLTWHGLVLLVLCAAIARPVGADEGQGTRIDVSPRCASVLIPCPVDRRSPFDGLFAADVRPAAVSSLRQVRWSIAEREGLGDDVAGFEDDARHQEAEKPPQPPRTGLKALAVETAHDFRAFPRRRSTWVILAIGAGAAAVSHLADDEVNAKLVGSDAVGKFFAPGKHMGAVYTQAAVGAGLYAIGRYMLPHTEGAPKTNKVSHIGFDMLRAIAVSQGITQAMKFAVQRDRPTGECCAFPSGHASASFATASVLERHLGYRGAWPTFLIASYVAASRLHDNRHYLSDVVFGAALGVSAGWSVVARHGRSNFTLVPAPVRGGMMITLTRTAPR